MPMYVIHVFTGKSEIFSKQGPPWHGGASGWWIRALDCGFWTGDSRPEWVGLVSWDIFELDFMLCWRKSEKISAWVETSTAKSAVDAMRRRELNKAFNFYYYYLPGKFH